jgi:hypothetical protein
LEPINLKIAYYEKGNFSLSNPAKHQF